MKKNPLYVYGAIIIFEGIFLLFSRFYTFDTIKYSLGIMLILASILGFFKALSRQRKQVEFSYHEMHALALLVYGLSVLLFGNTLETLTNLSVFLFIFYAFSEIIFCNWLFNLDKGVNYKILLLRVFLGLTVGLASIIIWHSFSPDKELVIVGFGVLFIMVGINVLIYVPIIKRKELQESLKQ